LGYTLGEGFGSLAGAVIGITAGLLDRFSQLSISAAVPSSPRASWESSRKHARKVAIAFGLAFGLANGIVYGIFDGIKEGLLSGVVIGLTVAFTVGAVAGIAVWIGASETWRTSLAFLQLSLGGRAPREGIDFLNDAYETRNILRTAGPIYQFRHARLQELLADQYEAAAPRLYGRMVPSIPSATG
jgi:hypothetical protein